MKPSSTLQTTKKTEKKEVSPQQKQTFVRLVQDGSAKIAGGIIDEMIKSGVINVRNLQRVLSRGDEIIEAINLAVREKVASIAENIVDRVKLISGATVLELDPTDGKETISKSAEVFTSYLDRSVQMSTCPPTKAAKVQVYEMIKNGTFAQIFGGMNDDLNKLVMTEAQIVQFVRKHHKWLRDEGYGTFFLYKEDEDFFVASVYLDSDGPSVYRFPLSYDYIWRARSRRRIVVPQLELET